MNLISIDLGGTNTRIARAGGIEKPEFVGMPIRRTNTHDYANDLAFIIDTARRLSGDGLIDALGIGVPGRVNSSKTDMIASRNLPEWANRNFCVELSKSLNCPVHMDNDAVAASLGEAYYGGTQKDFHYLIWGTGISAVSVRYVENKEIVATYIRPEHQELFDAWENECGGASIMHTYGKPGEQLATDEWEDVSKQFRDYLRQYIASAKPPALVFGGGLAVHHASAIRGHADSLGVSVRVTQFGGASGLVGGLGLIRRGLISAPGAA